MDPVKVQFFFWEPGKPEGHVRFKPEGIDACIRIDFTRSSASPRPKGEEMLVARGPASWITFFQKPCLPDAPALPGPR